MLPVSRQCSGTGLPPTLRVPAATVLTGPMVAPLKVASRAARSAQLPARAAPTAGVSWPTAGGAGGVAGAGAGSSPPQPATAATVAERTTRRQRRLASGLMGVSSKRGKSRVVFWNDYVNKLIAGVI